MLDASYKSELEKLRNFLKHHGSVGKRGGGHSDFGQDHQEKVGPVPVLVLQALLMNAPSLSAAADLLNICTKAMIGGDLSPLFSSGRGPHPFTDSALQFLIKNIDFSSLLTDRQREVEALVKIVRFMPNQKLAVSVICEVLNKDSFLMDVCPEIVELFGTVLIDSPCVRPKEKSRMGGLGDDYDYGPAESNSAAPHTYGTIPSNTEILKLKATMMKWIARVSRSKGVSTDSASMDCEGVDENLAALTDAIKMWGAQLSSLNLSFPNAEKGYGRDEMMPMLGRGRDAMDIAAADDDDGMEVKEYDDDDDDDDGPPGYQLESRGPSREGRDGGRMRMRDHGMGGMMGNRNERKRGGMGSSLLGFGSGLLGFGGGGIMESRSKPKKVKLPSTANRDRFLLDTWAWLASSQFESLCDSNNAEVVFKGLSSLCPAVSSQESPSCPLLHLTTALADGLGASAIKLHEPAVAAAALLPDHASSTTSATFRDVTQGILLHLVCARNISNVSTIVQDSRFWGLCLNWIQTLSKEQETRAFSKLRDVFSKVMRMYSDLSTRILSFDVTVQQIKWLYKLNADLDVIWQIVESQLWSGAHSSGTVTGIEIMNDMLTEHHDKATNLEQILSALMPSSKLCGLVQSLLEPSQWDALTLVNIRKLLCYPDMQYAVPSTMSSLPFQLVNLVDWFLTCIEGRSLFQKFFIDRWNDDFSKISEICDEWVKFCSRFANDTVTFEELADYGELLLAEGEVETFVSTVASYLSSQDAEGSITLPDASKIATVVKQWSDLHKIFNHEAQIGAVLEASAAHLAPSVKPQLTSLKTTLTGLCAEVRRKGKWEKQTTAVLAKYWKENKAAEVDARLVDISDELLKTMTVHADLLTWLRTQKDNDGFTNRVEYARGLQEMNTPIELWDRANNRVNDKFLANLKNVRSYLHGYLYAELPRTEWSFVDFINVFTSMNKKTVVSVICKNIEECGKKVILKALQQVLGCSAAKAGLGRLVRLYDTACRSSWICRNSEEVESGAAPSTSSSTGIGASVIKSYVTLRFCVEPVEDEAQESVDAMDTDAVLAALNHDEEAASWRYHSYQELLDFQSGIVLERDMSKDTQNLRTSLLVDEETSKEDAIVDSFLTQFSWIRRLGEVLQKLHEAGHFSYFPTYNQEISLNVPDAEYRSLVEDLEAQLESWLLCVKEVRLQYYFANFFDLKRFYGLKKLLTEGVSSPSSMDVAGQPTVVEQLANGLGDYICFINPNLACDSETRKEIATGLLESWQQGLDRAELSEAGTKMTSEVTLDLIASSVNGAFARVHRRDRRIYLDDMDQTVVADRLKRGVYVVQAASQKEEFDMCLTLSAIHGAFPEWENCLVCSPETSWENVLLLLLRWHGAWANGRESGMFCLVDVESLTYGTLHLNSYSTSVLALPHLSFHNHTLCRRSTPSGAASARVGCTIVT